MYTRFYILHVISDGVMFTECSSKKRETLQYRTREEKTEDSRSLFSSRSLPKSHQKERASA